MTTTENRSPARVEMTIPGFRQPGESPLPSAAGGLCQGPGVLQVKSRSAPLIGSCRPYPTLQSQGFCKGQPEGSRSPPDGRTLGRSNRGACRLPERRSCAILHPFVGTIQQYCKELADPDCYRPDHCPQCEAQRPSGVTPTGRIEVSPKAAPSDCTWLLSPHVDGHGVDSSIRVRRYSPISSASINLDCKHLHSGLGGLGVFQLYGWPRGSAPFASR
jgi:hypothetical protein